MILLTKTESTEYGHIRMIQRRDGTSYFVETGPGPQTLFMPRKRIVTETHLDEDTGEITETKKSTPIKYTMEEERG